MSIWKPLQETISCQFVRRSCTLIRWVIVSEVWSRWGENRIILSSTDKTPQDWRGAFAQMPLKQVQYYRFKNSTLRSFSMIDSGLNSRFIFNVRLLCWKPQYNLIRIRCFMPREVWACRIAEFGLARPISHWQILIVCLKFKDSIYCKGGTFWLKKVPGQLQYFS